MQGIIIEKDRIQRRFEDQLEFLQLWGDLQKKMRVIVIKETITPIKELNTTLRIKSKAMEDEFLKDIIPIKKSKGIVDKLWGLGKEIFKSREEIFEDEFIE